MTSKEGRNAAVVNSTGRFAAQDKKAKRQKKLPARLLSPAESFRDPLRGLLPNGVHETG